MSDKLSFFKTLKAKFFNAIKIIVI